MGVASLVLGIVSIIIGFIPFCNIIAFLPAITGIILGIVEIVTKSKKSEPKGMGIAGTVVSAIAIVFIILWNSVVALAIYNNVDKDELQTQIDNINNEIENQIINELQNRYN